MVHSSLHNDAKDYTQAHFPAGKAEGQRVEVAACSGELGYEACGGGCWPPHRLEDYAPKPYSGGESQASCMCIPWN